VEMKDVAAEAAEGLALEWRDFLGFTHKARM
jgi:hypothetical protein